MTFYDSHCTPKSSRLQQQNLTKSGCLRGAKAQTKNVIFGGNRWKSRASWRRSLPPSFHWLRTPHGRHALDDLPWPAAKATAFGRNTFLPVPSPSPVARRPQIQFCPVHPVAYGLADESHHLLSSIALGQLVYHLRHVSSAAYKFMLTISVRIRMCLRASTVDSPEFGPRRKYSKSMALWAACAYVGSSEGPRPDLLPLIYGQQSLTHL